jgi:hypothetical protein
MLIAHDFVVTIFGPLTVLAWDVYDVVVWLYTCVPQNQSPTANSTHATQCKGSCGWL